MDITKLKYDRTKVIGVFKELNDESVVATANCTILIPSRFVSRGLATVGIETSFAGYFCIIVNGYYGVSITASLIHSAPSSTTTVTINEEEYYEFRYEKGDVIVKDTSLLQSDKIVFKVYRELIATGHVPWFINYTVYGKLLNTAKRFGGAGLGDADRATFEVIAASLARSSKDPTKQLRYTLKTQKDMDTFDVRYVPLNSVIYGASNTTARLMGSRLEQGISASLANPSESVEDIEELLRK